MKTYKIRRFINGRSKLGKPFRNYSLTVPGYIAERLPEGMEFVCELTESGILFKPAKLVEEREEEVPQWAKNNGTTN